MQRVYLDNAATSFPKPGAVTEAMTHFATRIGASPGRGAYDASVEAAAMLHDTRASLARLLGEPDPHRIAFTLNCTDALHLAIHGVVARWRRAGEPIHMVTTAMDHNSVLRPLNDLRHDGVTHTRVDVDPATGLVHPDAIASAITSHTRLVCVVHGSNVSGTVQDIPAIGDRCQAAGVPLLVDAAQTVGHHPIDPAAMGISVLAMPGHKGLLGPLGTGALWLGEGMTGHITPVRTGGTGSRSEDDVHPTDLPDRYEAGSHNTIGLAGLGASLQWLHDQGLERIEAHEATLTARMLEGLLPIDGLQVHGPHTTDHRCGVFALTCAALTPAAFATALEADHGVLGRAGVHCAPGAHATFGTLAGGGATRLSLGQSTTVDDVDHAIAAVRAVVHHAMHAPMTASTGAHT
ncbi:MAG: aminotransferase class V-fold PLP-dependent enzyme [Phycisphaerales bacterium]|nr:aminotransferase class V-fold PLP-dependent enzyme [Phycisphaerales bacterium]